MGRGWAALAPKYRRRRILTGVLAIVLIFLLLALIFWVCGGRDRVQSALYPREYSQYVEKYSGEYGVDPMLVYAVIYNESRFRPDAVSNVGARGLMQITEVTFDWIKSKIAPGEDLTFDDLYDPAVNIRFGVYYISACLERYHGDVSTAAAAYHSGWGTVDGLLEQEPYSDDGQILHTFPYEQMGLYVNKINRAYERYQALYGA